MLLGKQALKRYFIFPLHLTMLLHYTWRNEERQNSILSLKCCSVVLRCQTSTSRWLNLLSLVTCNSCSCCYV